MKFMFSAYNHNELGRRSLEDVILIISQQLEALGHRCGWDNERFITPQDDGINVVVEGFVHPDQIKVLAAAKERGARFLILATEEPTDRGFNYGTQENMAKRQEMFPEAARFCEGILHLVPGERVTRWYSQFAPAAYVELGYAPGLVRASAAAPDHDFGFYGSLSPRRRTVLKRLANATGSAVKVVADFSNQQDRDREMQRAKVILQIRKFEKMGLVSSSRCATALSIGRPVIAEPHEMSKPWDEVVDFASSESHFHSLCLMAKATWRGFHAKQMAKFKAKFPPEVCIGQPLRQIGVLA